MSSHLIPKFRKKRNITLEELEAQYDTPLVHVAQKMGLSITMLKKVCRGYGIQRWPHRQIRSINRSITKICKVGATSENKQGGVLERIKRLENKKRLISFGASSGLQSNIRNAIFLAEAEELANGYSSSNSSEEGRSGTPAPPTNASSEFSGIIGDEISKNIAIRKAVSKLEKKVEAKAMKNRGSCIHKESGGDELVKPPKATLNNNCASTAPPTTGFRFVMKQYPQEKGVDLDVPESHPQVRMKTVKTEHLSTFQPAATSSDVPGLYLPQNTCHPEETSENVDMQAAMRALCNTFPATPSPGILINRSMEVDHEKFSHSTDAWDPPLSTFSLLNSPRFIFDISNPTEPPSNKAKQVEVVDCDSDSESEEEMELLGQQVRMPLAALPPSRIR